MNMNLTRELPGNLIYTTRQTKMIRGLGIFQRNYRTPTACRHKNGVVSEMYAS